MNAGCSWSVRFSVCQEEVDMVTRTLAQKENEVAALQELVEELQVPDEYIQACVYASLFAFTL